MLLLMLKNEVKSEIPIINNLATTSALTAAENKIPSVSNLVKKFEYNTKINKVEKKLLLKIVINITTLELKKLTAEISNSILKWLNLARQSDITYFLNQGYFDNKPKDVKWKENSNQIKTN